MKKFIALTLLILLVLLLSCETVFTVKENASEKNKTCRFQIVETFIFQHKLGGGLKAAEVYKDTKTGICYLYVYSGDVHGGSSITRLWDK